MTAALGYSDLVRVLREMPAEERLEAADLLGFRRVAKVREAAVVESASPAGQMTNAASSPARVAPVGFFRVEAAVETESPAPSRSPLEQPRLSREELSSKPRAPLPPAPLLAAWSTLTSRLQRALHAHRPGCEPDVGALIRGWARGEYLRRLPRLMRRTWAALAEVWVDRSSRLTPFWHDQDMVVRRLVSLCGSAGLRLRVLDGAWQAELTAWHGDLVGTSAIDPTVPVLVLGDLGFFGAAADRACWHRTARRLRREGVRLAALVPCPVRRWDRALARAWNAMPWERSSTAPHGTPERRAEALLRLVAPTALVQPGLVRALRRLLPATEADASTEVDVWRHADVQASDVHGLVLKTEASARWRAQFANEVKPWLQADVRRLIQRWHGNWRPELIHAETIAWMALRSIAPEIGEPPGRPADAEAFVAKVAATLDGDDADSAMARHYSRHMTGALPDQVYADIPALVTVWSLAYEGVAGARLPSTIDPGRRPVRWRPGPRVWNIRQRGDLLVLFPAAADGSWTDREPGSPVATLTAAVPEIWVQRGKDARATRTLLDPGNSIALAAGERLRLRSDCGEVTLGVWEQEPWAVAAGRDRFGLWAAFEVEGVQQRMRWIPPGGFRMGSHESEVGRFDDEGPQHWVTLTKGYWLGSTPVTQALWRVVMGENPSAFKSDDRPVEQVSWDDCQAFIGQLNRQLDGLSIRLPTEAEWERACRAGTTTATWIGDLMQQPEGDAPELDAIAWYQTNSGVDFELGNAIDLSNSNGRHHTRAGTHPVGRKLPNPYGLHDMLGNIFEWCQDAADNPLGNRYTSQAVEDPVSPNRGSFQICRGASWRHDAILVRAASRDGNARGYRNDNLGFRLVADHEPALSKPLSVQSFEQHKRTPRGGRHTEPLWGRELTSPPTPPRRSAASASAVPTSPTRVVMTRPAVIVGTPAKPAATSRIRKAREDEGRGFGQGLISERSLDDVILAYLSEDADEK